MMKVKATVFVAAALAASAAMAADIYVDSTASGGDGSSAASPLPTIRAALDIASAGDTIWVRGGSSCSYSITAESDTLPIDVGKAGLSIRAYDTEPGDGGQASVTISNTYIADGGRAHIVSNGAENVLIQGLAFSFGKKSLGERNMASVSAIRNFAPSLTIDNCAFAQSQITDFWGGSGYDGIVKCTSSNLLVKGCFFGNINSDKGSGATYTPVFFRKSATLVGNVLSNVTYVATPKNIDNNDTIYEFNFISNVVYGLNGGSKSGLFVCINKGPHKGEISYNRFVKLRETSNAHKYTLWMSDRLKDAGSSMHHNTIIGNDKAAFAMMSNGMRSNKIFSNIFILAAEADAVLYLYGDGGNLPRGKTSPFDANSSFRNNAYLARSVDYAVKTDKNPMTAADGYDLDGEGMVITDNIVLSDAPEFLETANIWSENYYRYKDNRYPNLAKGGWTDGGKYPVYIGAVEPLHVPSASVFMVQ